MKIKKYYINNLHKPTYYRAIFSKQELKDIAEITDSTASIWISIVNMIMGIELKK